MENIRIIDPSITEELVFKKTDFSEYQYLGMVYSEHNKNKYFYYVLGNKIELLLYQFAFIQNGLLNEKMFLFSKDVLERSRKYGMNFRKKRAFRILKIASRFFKINQYHFKKIFSDITVLNEAYYLENKENVLSELNLTEVTNESEYYNPLENKFSENFNFFIEYFEYLLRIYSKKYEPLETGAIGMSKDGKVYFSLGEMKYDLIVNNKINTKFSKTLNKKYYCYIGLRGGQLYDDKTVHESLLKAENYFSNNSVEDMIYNIVLTKTKKMVKDQITIYNLKNIKSLNFNFNHEDIYGFRLPDIRLKINNRIEILKKVKEIVFLKE